MGQELVARAGKATSLWSVQALLDNPEMVRAVHDEYFAAGADVATTNTYSVLPDRLEKHELGDRLKELTQIACQQAVDARSANGSGIVAGSLGPQGFSYQPDLAPPAEKAAEVYSEICKIQKTYVDVFVAETMSSVDQATGALMGMSGHGKPFWLALSVDDNDGTKLRSGEDIADILPALKKYEPAAVLVNCSSPEAVTAAIPKLIASGLPVGAYANGFTKIVQGFDKVGATVDMLTARADLGPDAYADFAQTWANDGATLIGGCCEVGPAHIAELKRRFG
jgi:S-methylmethionine-dependent homocysteine/selenocysteine methylase